MNKSACLAVFICIMIQSAFPVWAENNQETFLVHLKTSLKRDG